MNEIDDCEFDDIEQDIELPDDHGIELIYSEIADSQIQLSWILGGQGDD